MDERTFTDAHGVAVFSRWWLIDNPSGLMVIAHGASEHSGRYDRFAQALNAAGYTVVAIDHRGHGRTSESTGVGFMGEGGGAATVEDLHQLREQAAAEVGADVPVFFFGHSMGSLIGLAYLVAHSEGLTGAILCGFAADPTDAGAVGQLLAGMADQRDQPAIGLLAANNAPFDPARTPFDWLSRDDAEVDKYIADKYCGDNHPLTFGYFIDLFDIVAPAAENLGAIQCPVFVIAGAMDPAAGMGANATKLGDGLNAAGVKATTKVYPDARHELLNETNRDEVTADIVAWLQSVQ